MPHIGWFIEESSSDRFSEFMKKGESAVDFISEVKLIEREGVKKALYGDITHDGHAVKKILFERT